LTHIYLSYILQEQKYKAHFTCGYIRKPRVKDKSIAEQEFYNEKYFKQAKRMMDELYELKFFSSDNVWDDVIEIIFYHLWHGKGRQARMGTAMMGQDYAHWHGFFELAKNMEKITKEYKRLKSKEK